MKVLEYLPVSQANVPLLLESRPGVGKSAAVHAWAAHRKVPCVTLVGSLSDSGDVIGYAIQNGDQVKFALPEWTSTLQDGGVLFLDEINRGPRLVRSAMLRIIAERAIHSFKLPETVTIIAACNPEGDGDELDTAMRSRFCHLSAEPDIRSFARQFRSDQWDTPGSLNEDWKAREPSIRLVIGDFLEHRPELLSPKDHAAEGGIASPRTWTLLASGVAACEQLGLSPTPVIRGLVGEGPGKEFAKFMKEYALPNPRDILNGKWKPDGRRDFTRAALLSIAPLVIDNHTWLKAWEQVLRCPKDIAVIVAKKIAARRPKGAKTPKGIGELLEVVQ